jgi:hypothetical protein
MESVWRLKSVLKSLRKWSLLSYLGAKATFYLSFLYPNKVTWQARGYQNSLSDSFEISHGKSFGLLKKIADAFLLPRFQFQLVPAVCSVLAIFEARNLFPPQSVLFAPCGNVCIACPFC